MSMGKTIYKNQFFKKKKKESVLGIILVHLLKIIVL